MRHLHKYLFKRFVPVLCLKLIQSSLVYILSLSYHDYLVAELLCNLENMC